MKKLTEGRKSIRQQKYEGEYGVGMNKPCKECGMPQKECLCEKKKVKRRIKEGVMKRMFTDIQIAMEADLKKGLPKEKVIANAISKFGPTLDKKGAEYIFGTLDVEEYGVKGMKWGHLPFPLTPKKGIEGGSRVPRGSSFKVDANKKTAANWLDKYATRKFAKSDKESGLTDEKDVKKIADLIRSGDFKKAGKKIDNLDTAVREEIPANLRRWLKKHGAKFDAPFDYVEEQIMSLLDVGEMAFVSDENYSKLDSKAKSKIKPNEELTVISAFPGLADSIVLTNNKGDKVRISGNLLTRKQLTEETKKMKLSEVKQFIRETVHKTLDEASRGEIEKLIGKEAAMKYRKASTGEVKTYFGRFVKLSGEGVYMGVLGKGLRKFLISNIISVSPAKFEAKQMAELDEMCKETYFGSSAAKRQMTRPKKETKQKSK